MAYDKLDSEQLLHALNITIERIAKSRGMTKTGQDHIAEASKMVLALRERINKEGYPLMLADDDTAYIAISKHHLGLLGLGDGDDLMVNFVDDPKAPSIVLQKMQVPIVEGEVIN